jgi:hypothetical protein
LLEEAPRVDERGQRIVGQRGACVCFDSFLRRVDRDWNGRYDACCRWIWRGVDASRSAPRNAGDVLRGVVDDDR